MPEDEKKAERGRAPLKGLEGPNDVVKHVGLKMPLSLELKFIEKAKELREKGFKPVGGGNRLSKSDVIRTLAEYWLDSAEDIYTEKKAANE